MTQSHAAQGGDTLKVGRPGALWCFAPSRFPSRPCGLQSTDAPRYSVQVQHSSDRQRDGVWHEIETADDIAYAAERGGLFQTTYGPRPVRILDRMTNTALTVEQARKEAARGR